MSTLKEIESAIQDLPREDVAALHEWIENYLEDKLEMTPEFHAKIARAEQEMADGKGRIRNSQAKR